LNNKAAKGKKGAIVAMIVGTKAQTVIILSMKNTINYGIQFSEITLDMKHGIDCQNVSPTCVTD
jgi:hypothetical protein